MRLNSVFLFACALFSPLSTSDELNDLNYLTEQYPPYNYDIGEGVEGIAVDVLLEASKRVQSAVTAEQIQVQPWPRAYRSTLIKPNTVLFSTTRTELRENIFQWVGPISSTRVVVLAKKSSNIQINEALELIRYRIGVIRDDVGEQLLLELGIPRDSMIESSVPQTLAKQFARDRIDLWAYDENVAKWLLKKGGYQSEQFEAVYVLSDGELFFAFNKDTDSALAAQLQQGIDEIKQDVDGDGISLYQQILNKYR